MGSFIGNCLNSGVSEEYRQDILENNRLSSGVKSGVFYALKSKAGPVGTKLIFEFPLRIIVSDSLQIFDRVR